MYKNRSTIEFTETVQPVLHRLRLCGFDIKDIVNAGILLFDELNGDEQKAAIARTGGAVVDKEVAEKYKKMITRIRTERFLLLSDEEQKIVEDLRATLGPEPKKKRGQKTGG